MTITIIVPERDGGSVADINAAVETCEAAAALVTPILDYTADITALALLTAELAALGPISDDIVTVAGISANVTSVAGNATNINTVATNIANVNTVAGVSGNVTTVAGIAANVTTVAGISGNVTTVAGVAVSVAAVATISADVSAVATIAANVTTVAGISANVTSVAGISADIVTVAGNIVAIQGASAAASAAAASEVAAETAETNAAASAASALASATAAAASASTSEWVARDDMRQRMQALWQGRPEAAIVVFAQSQSLGTWRSGTQVSGTGPANCYMLAGGAYCQQMAFYSTNAIYPMKYADVSSAIAFAEPASGQGPLAGIAHAMSGKFARVYLCSPAIGARTLAVLSQDGPAANIHAALKYLCKHAIDAGYRPRVVMPVAQGEADATANTGESAYYTAANDAYRHAQALAVDAMGVPGEPVPLLFGQMMQMSNTGDKDREIIMAVNRIADDLPNAMLVPGHDMDFSSDRVHPSSTGFFQKGYRYGWFANEFFHNGRRVKWPKIAHVKQLTTTSFRVYWSDEMEQHTTSNPTFVMGENLDANYLKGIGWDDNGTQRDVSAVTDYGAYSDFTVATITGTIDQQWCLHGMQRTTSTLTSGQDYHSGTLYRKTTRAAGAEMFGQPLQALTTYDHRPWARIERVRPEAA